MLTKPNILRLFFFLAAFAGALYYPVREVLAFERPKVPPTEMRFRVVARDPYDPMRGHYLRLQIRDEIKIPQDEYKKRRELFEGRKVVAVLETGRDGFAHATALKPICDAPADKPFVKVDQFWFRERPVSNCVVVMPFDRYFINEKLAGDAEGLLQNITRDNKHSAVLVVNIYADGRYAVKDLLIDDQPLLTHLRTTAKQAR